MLLFNLLLGSNWCRRWRQNPVRLDLEVINFTAPTQAVISRSVNFTAQQVDFSRRVIVFSGLLPHLAHIRRSVPVPDSFLQLLDEVHEVRRVQSGPQAMEKLWLQSKKTMHEKVSRVIAAAGISGGPHALPKGIRHGFFVQAICRRVAITRLQKWMGHSFMEYTAQYVAQLLQHAPELLGDERGDAERLW